jgi:hypothetical protein
MKKAATRRRKSIDFSNGIRGKYANATLVIVGDTEKSAKAVLKRVSRVLDSAGTSKRELEAAVNRARDLIATTRQP